MTDWRTILKLSALQANGRISDLCYCHKENNVDYYVSFFMQCEVGLPGGLKKIDPPNYAGLHFGWVKWSERGPSNGKMAEGASVLRRYVKYSWDS